MRKVIGMGETIMDIIFRQNQPTAAVPGGSSFNSIVSIGRTGIPALFIGETGQDEVGRQIVDFLRQNHVDTSYLKMRKEIKSAVSLAFLDENHDANYLFYKQPPCIDPSFNPPAVEPEDILQFGSYYAIYPGTRLQIKSFLEYAHRQGAILYYDLNFRQTHRHELENLFPAIHENFRLSNIVRGSSDDFEIMYGERDPETIYQKHIAKYCPLFICTQGREGITLCTPVQTYRYPVIPIQTVSTIGAGDNFNAGFVYGLVRHHITRDALPGLTADQ